MFAGFGRCPNRPSAHFSGGGSQDRRLGADSKAGRRHNGAVPADFDPARIELLSQQWASKWPGVRPITYELRDTARDRWVRFHSLPNSKRYAETEDERQEILRKDHQALAELSELHGTVDDSVIVVSYAWSTSSVPDPDEAQIADRLTSGTYWTSLLVDADQRMPDESDSWVHLFARVSAWRNGSLDPLLLRIADDEQRALIMPADLRWLLAPYDGGMDVVAATTKIRDDLKARHADWLSAHPSGL